MANNADNGFICAQRYSQAPKHTDSHSITGLLSCFIYQPLGAGLGSDSYLPATVNSSLCDRLLQEHAGLVLPGIAKTFSPCTETCLMIA